MLLRSTVRQASHSSDRCSHFCLPLCQTGPQIIIYDFPRCSKSKSSTEVTLFPLEQSLLREGTCRKKNKIHPTPHMWNPSEGSSSNAIWKEKELKMYLRKGSWCQEKETYHCHRTVREERRKGHLWGRRGREGSIRGRSRNNRSLWMFPKWEEKAGICKQIPFSRKKKTFLMFLGSSQAISLLPHLPISSFSALQERSIAKHRFPHRCPAVTHDCTERYQTPSMPCTVQWCAVPRRSGELPQHWVLPTHSLVCGRDKMGQGCQGALALLSISWGTGQSLERREQPHILAGKRAKWMVGQ